MKREEEKMIESVKNVQREPKHEGNVCLAVNKYGIAILRSTTEVAYKIEWRTWN